MFKFHKERNYLKNQMGWIVIKTQYPRAILWKWQSKDIHKLSPL
jgi:hypothetical protein